MTSAYHEGAKNYYSGSESPSSKVDYKTSADEETRKLINKALYHVRAMYYCPLCARKHDVQDPHEKRQDLGNHMLYGHENWEIQEWLKELEDYAELKRGIKRY